MEKTCAAEKNRTTDTMWVEKKKRGGKRGKKGEVLGTERSPCDVLKRNMTKKRWVDRPRDSSLILTYHQLHRVTSGHW